MTTRMTVCILVSTIILTLMSCKRFYSLDDFLFEPEKIDEYLKPEDLAEWPEIRNIIPDSLIEPVTMTSMANTIYGFFVWGSLDSDIDRQITVLYCNGNSQNINRYWMRVEYLWEMGFNVFIFDYQGYGKSEGSPSGKALFSDGRAALDYVLSRVDVDISRVVYYGYSLGSYVATYLAAEERRPAGLILESAPASISALLRDSGLLDLDGAYVAEADFNNEKRIADIDCPLLMMHGRDDDFVVFERHVPYIWNKAAEPKDSLWADGAVHDNVPETLGIKYYEKVIEFVEQYIMN